jgi:hypothetical protein
MKKPTRGLGFVYQRGGVQWLCYSVRGKRIRESADVALRIDPPNHATPADALKLLKRRFADSQNGKPVGPQVDRISLADLGEMLLEFYRANGRRSLDRAQHALARLYEAFGRDARAFEITSDRITAYQARRRSQSYNGRPIANATINYELAILRKAFRLAARANKVTVRPEFDMLDVDNARKGFFGASGEA